MDVVVGYESVDFLMIDSLRGAFRLRDEVNRVFLNDGHGMLQPGPTFGASGAPTRALALADVDRDGRLDIIVGNDCTQNQVFFNGAGARRPPR
jgi:VCBS repeat protein